MEDFVYGQVFDFDREVVGLTEPPVYSEAVNTKTFPLLFHHFPITY